MYVHVHEESCWTRSFLFIESGWRKQFIKVNMNIYCSVPYYTQQKPSMVLYWPQYHILDGLEIEACSSYTELTVHENCVRELHVQTWEGEQNEGFHDHVYREVGKGKH